MIKRLYRKIRNTDKIESLTKELAEINKLYTLKALELARLQMNVSHVMNSTAKWRSLHSSTSSEQFPNTIRVVFSKILNSPTELLRDFNKFTTSCVHDPNRPGGYTYR